MNSTRRAIALTAVLVAGFSLIFLLPESYGLRESAVIKAFPDQLGAWESVPQDTPERVTAILGKETYHQQTMFFKRGEDDLFDRIAMFMVVSGDDMNASIHRPERCFPTQGISISDTSEVTIPLKDGGELAVTRLAAEALTTDGVRVPRLSYYWFVGSDRTTNSHYERALIDIKDRVFKGSNQRWGYVMATVEHGIEHERLRELDEAEADRLLQEFLAELFPHIHRVDRLRG